MSSVITISRSLCPALVLTVLAWTALHAQRPAQTAQAKKQAIAHRGASAYRPEHTEAAYRLAMDQKIDYVEQDLGVTKDSQLICIHDDTLERTTNVAEVFPDRSTTIALGSRTPAKHWLVNDFTLADIKRLDAGKWFKPEFAGARLLTFQEAIDLVRAHPGFGMYPELKSPQLYKSRGIDQVKLFVDAVRKNGLEKPESLLKTPVIIQSFDEEAIRRVSIDLPTIPRVFLTSKDEDVTEARLRALAGFATGIAPEKFVIARHPEMVARAHAAGLTVTSWTFRSDEKTEYPNVGAEMSHFLYDLGIDALFTNNPDLFPRTAGR
jgi:glycerophosphoryl diester phosphodiesterase